MSLSLLRPAPLALAAALACCLTPVLAQTAAGGLPQQPLQFSIAAEPLGKALGEWALRTGVQLIVAPALVEGRQAPAVAGRLTPQQALQRLLAGSGLASRVEAGAVVVHPAPAAGGGEAALATVVVTAQADSDGSSERTGAYAARSVTVGKSAQSLRDIPQSVSVVTRQLLDDRNLQSLDDAMRTVAGVTVEPGSTGGNHGNFYLRGYAIDSVQVDGVTAPASTGNDLSTGFGMAIYDRIEVLRGAAALFQGAGDPGGSLNLVRKRPGRQREFNLQLSAGSWDRYYAEADMGGPLAEDGRVRGRLVAAYQDHHSFVDHVTARKPLLYGIVEADLAPGTTVSAGAVRQSYKGRPAFGLPAYTDGRMLDIARSSYLDPIWNHISETNQEYFAELQHQTDRGGQFRLRAMYREQDEPSRLFGWSDCAADPATGDSCLVSWAYRSHWKTLGLDGFMSQSFSAFGSDANELVLGADYRKIHKNFQYGGGQDAPINILHPDNNVPLPTDYRFTNGNDTKIEQYGLYGRTTLRPHAAVRVSLGGRLSWWQNHTQNRNAYFNQFSESDTRANGRFTPFAGVVVDLTPQLSAYASHTRIFAPQTATDSAGQTLSPRTGQQYEIGLKGEWMERRVDGRLALFRIEDTNRAMTDTRNPLYSVAAGKMRSQGLETELNGRLAPGWDITAGYTYTQTRTLEGTDDEKAQRYVFVAPRHSFKLWTKYRFGAGALQGVSLGGGLQSTSRLQRLNGDVMFSQGPVTTAALQLGYRINQNFDATVTVNNLFDKVYYQRVWAAFGSNYYGEPRNVMVTLRGRF